MNRVITRLLGLKAIVMNVIILLIVFIGNYDIVAQTSWEPPSPKGVIESPHEGSQVESPFEVKGTISGIPRNLWLVEKTRQRYWAKEPKLSPQDGRWTGEVYKDCPPGGEFELLLMDVSDELSQYFEEWLRKGHASKRYIGITEVKMQKYGYKILDVKKYRLSD